jgi:hypothetical protein
MIRALAAVLQFVEGLSDRQAADALRDCVAWTRCHLDLLLRG